MSGKQGMRRHTQLENFVASKRIEISETADMVYADLSDDDKKVARYAVCGLWFEGYAQCSQSGSACCFIMIDSKFGEITNRRPKPHCPHSDQKVRAHILTPERVRHIITKKPSYNTKW